MSIKHVSLIFLKQYKVIENIHYDLIKCVCWKYKWVNIKKENNKISSVKYHKFCLYTIQVLEDNHYVNFGKNKDSEILNTHNNIYINSLLEELHI